MTERYSINAWQKLRNKDEVFRSEREFLTFIRSIHPIKGGHRTKGSFLSDVTYLNYAFSYPPAIPVIDGVGWYTKETAANHLDDLDRAIRLDYGLMADFIGAKNVNSIAINDSCTNSLKSILGFDKLWDKKKGNIVVTEDAYFALVDTVTLLCEELGFSFRVARASDRSEGLTVKDIGKKVDDNTQLILVPHVSNLTGEINSIDDICAFGTEKDIPVLIDGAAAVGHMLINVSELGDHFYAVSGGKIGHKGSGFLYVPEKYIGLVHPLAGSGDASASYESRFKKVEDKGSFKKWWPGVSPDPAFHGLALSLDMFRYIGMDLIQRHNRELVTYFFEEMNLRKKLKNKYDLIIKNPNAVSVCTFSHKNPNINPKLHQYLREKGYNLMLLKANLFPYEVEKGGRFEKFKDKYFIRPSIHIPTSKQDIMNLLVDLEDFVPSRYHPKKESNKASGSVSKGGPSGVGTHGNVYLVHSL